MNAFRGALANQLGFPSGWFGRLLLQFLNHHNALMNDLVLQQLSLTSGDRLLEIGFGGGDLLHKILQTGLTGHLMGIERSYEALSFCQKRFQAQMDQGRLELQLADAATLPLISEDMHHICTVNTLYFWSDPARVVNESYRVLKPGGQLTIGYNSKSVLEKQKLLEQGFRAYEVAEVETLLQTAGFEQIKTVPGDRTQVFFCTTGRVHAQPRH